MTSHMNFYKKVMTILSSTLLVWSLDMSATTYTWIGSGSPITAANWTPAGGPPRVGDTAIIDTTTNAPTLDAGSFFWISTLQAGTDGVVFNLTGGSAMLFSGVSGLGVVNTGPFSTTFNLGEGIIEFRDSVAMGSGAGSTTIYNLTGNSSFSIEDSTTGNTDGGLVQINITGSGNLMATQGSLTIDSLNNTSTTLTTISPSGVLTLGNAFDQTISGRITNFLATATLVKQGTGKLSLTNTNVNESTFGSGSITNVTVNGGTLSILRDSNLGLSTCHLALNNGTTLQTGAAVDLATRNIDLTGSATLDLNGFSSSQGSGAGVISGTGSLTIISSNTGSPVTFTMHNENVYTGGTTIGNGVDSVNLIIIGSGTPGAPEGVFTVNTNSTYDLSAAGSTPQYVGDLSGNGSIIMGAIPFIVGTSSGLMTTFGGTLSGTASFTKIGSGTLTLKGICTYSGNTTVAAGKLVVGVSGTGSIQSDTIVKSGATLGGSGEIIGAVIIESGGTLTPGNSTDTLHIDGTLGLASGSTTNIEVSPTQVFTQLGSSLSSSVSVTGTATLGGHLNVIAQSGSYAATNTYTVLTSGGIAESELVGAGTTTFQSLSSTGFFGNLSYTATSVLLTLQPLLFNANQFSGNNKGIANALNQMRFNTDMQLILQILFQLPPDQQTAAFETISTSRSAFPSYAAMLGSFSFINMIGSQLSNYNALHHGSSSPSTVAAMMRMNPDEFLAQSGDEVVPRGSSKSYAREGQSQGFWLQGFGDFARQDSQNQTPSSDLTTAGALVGYEWISQEYDGGVAGIAAGYIGSHISNSHHLGSSDVNSFVIGPYGTAYLSNAFIELGLYLSFNWIDNDRHVFFPGFDAHAKDSHAARQAIPHFGLGYDYVFSWGIIEPYATIDYVANWEEGYTEKGAGALNMKVSSRFSSILRSELGLRFYQNWYYDWGIFLIKEKAAYLNKAPFDVGQMTAIIGGGPGTFTVNAFTDTQNQAAVAFELFTKGNNNWFGSLEYAGEFGSGYISNQVIGTVGKYF